MTVNITLHIGSHTVSMPNTPVEREQVTRLAAQQLNDRYRYYVQQYPKASQEQIWLYIALESTIALRSDVRDKAIEPLEVKIQILNQLVEKKLNEKIQ